MHENPPFKIPKSESRKAAKKFILATLSEIESSPDTTAELPAGLGVLGHSQRFQTGRVIRRVPD
jgi:hypothetical protein